MESKFQHPVQGVPCPGCPMTSEWMSSGRTIAEIATKIGMVLERLERGAAEFRELQDRLRDTERDRSLIQERMNSSDAGMQEILKRIESQQAKLESLALVIVRADASWLTITKLVALGAGTVTLVVLVWRFLFDLLAQHK